MILHITSAHITSDRFDTPEQKLPDKNKITHPTLSSHASMAKVGSTSTCREGCDTPAIKRRVWGDGYCVRDGPHITKRPRYLKRYLKLQRVRFTVGVWAHSLALLWYADSKARWLHRVRGVDRSALFVVWLLCPRCSQGGQQGGAVCPAVTAPYSQSRGDMTRGRDLLCVPRLPDCENPVPEAAESYFSLFALALGWRHKS